MGRSRVRGPYARFCERDEVSWLLTSPYSIAYGVRSKSPYPMVLVPGEIRVRESNRTLVAVPVTGGVGRIRNRRYRIVCVRVKEVDIRRIGAVKVIIRARPGTVMAAPTGQAWCAADENAMAESVVLTHTVRAYVPDRGTSVRGLIVAGCASCRIVGRAGNMAGQAVNANPAISHTAKVLAVAQRASASNVPC